MKIYSLIKIISVVSIGFLMLRCTSTEEDDPDIDATGFYSVADYSSSFPASFGSVAYRVYFPLELLDSTYLIHVSRGGFGIGDDRDQLLSYVEELVSLGYVVLQLDHRPANSALEAAQFRGQEIKEIVESIVQQQFDFGGFGGSIYLKNQGFLGHSAGALEGIMVTGAQMQHGNYYNESVRAVYLMSLAGNNPDQFGILPTGFSAVGDAAIFIAFGEQEKNVNGVGNFMANDWRLQPFDGMNTAGPRFEAFIKGPNTTHSDIHRNNPDLVDYNLNNAVAFFNYYLRGIGQLNDIGSQSLPPVNGVTFDKKGL